MVRINGDRLLQSLHTLRSFGATGNGVVRQTFSDVDMEARSWLREEMEKAHLDAVVDGVGSVVGTSRQPGPALIIGSHSDTQPEGGWLDGAMGVMYGLEVARTLAEHAETADLAVDVVAWSDEEGTYTSCLGSHSFVDAFPDEHLAHANADGETVGQALQRLGLMDRPRARFDSSRHIGYLEAHIEQGPHLEDHHQRIGVVSSIVGIRAMEITFTGEQNHAGSTPMNRRADAGVALFEFAVRLRERLKQLAGPTSVWTIGNAQLLPGGESIIPGKAVCAVQFRDPNEVVLDAFQDAIGELAREMTASGPVGVRAEMRRDPLAPVEMDAGFRAALGAAAEVHVPGEWVDMPSAAIHDANVLADYLPCGMLFIPSIGGVSHDFTEDSSELDIVTGAHVLATAAVTILRAAQRAG